MKLIPIFLPEDSCPFHCAFCNVRIANGENAPVRSPVDVQPEIEAALATLSKHHPGEPVEIAFFGGTFTAGDRTLMEHYLNTCAQFLSNGVVSGIRVSTRPDCIDTRIIKLLKQYGVTTVELGVESFDNEVLQRLNRGHSAEMAIQAVQLLKSNGFITGIHLMAGCPGETGMSFRSTIRTTVKLQPDTVRIHPLLVLTDTRLAETGFQAPNCDKIMDKLALAIYCIEGAGIRVIRVGLQPTDSLNQTGQIQSGCFHAALRHRVMSRIYRHFFLKFAPESESVVTISRGHLSYAIGFRRENAVEFPHLKFIGNKSVGPWDVLVNGTCYHMLTEGLYEIEELFER